MPIVWDERYSQELKTLSAQFESLDPDSVARRGVKQTTIDMAERVRFKVFAHPDIKSPASKLSEYESGPGPAMATQKAWNVEATGHNTFTVEPHPLVRQRAVILEYGTRDPIKARSADAMRFTVNGVPMYRKEVSGITARGYWRQAIQEIRAEGKFEQNLEDEWEDELEKYF